LFLRFVGVRFLEEFLKGLVRWRSREEFELPMPLLVWFRKSFSVVFEIPKKLKFELINVVGRPGRCLPLHLSCQLS
jgi:hypothetical protein